MGDIPHFLLDTVLRDWVWGLFVNGFCVHLTRPLVLLAVFAVAFLGFGRSLGLPALFLRPSRFERFAIGAGVGVLVWQAVLAGFLFEEFATNYTTDRPPFCEARPHTARFWSYADADYQGRVVPWPGRETERDPFRYRYAPASVVTIGLYAGALAGVLGAFAAVGVLAWVVRFVIRLLAGAWKATPKTAAVEPKIHTPGHYLAVRVPFVGGMLAGFLTAAGVAWVFLPADLIYAHDPPHPSPAVRLAYGTGRAMVGLGGWGNASARGDLIDDGIDLGTDSGGQTPAQIRAAKVEAARVKYQPYYPVYGVFFLGFAALLVWNVGLLFSRAFSPAAGILLLLHLLLAGQTFADYFFAAPMLLLGVLLALLVLCGGRYKMRFPGLTEHYGRPIPLQQHYDEVQKEPVPPPPAPPDPPDLTALFSNQLKRWNDGRKKPLVMVCVSGGGSRAAAWTVRVLTELEQRIPEFPYHVRVITGASGGMFGAAYYTASLPPPGDGRVDEGTAELPKAKSGRYPSRGQLNATVRQDFLSPVTRALVGADLLRPFQPFAYGGDRGAALEHAWSDLLGGWLDQSFADLWAGERDGWRPSLAFSPMLVEDGRQLVISNLSLRTAMVNLGREAGGAADAILSREGVEFFKLFALAGRDPAAVRRAFRVSTAARMSASFPYVFPAVPLPTAPRRRVVDAGYYDNYGVSLAAGWLFTHIGWLKEHVSHVAVVHVRDGVSTGERQMLAPAADTSTAFALAAEGLTTPPAGLNASRTAASTFRNDNLLHLLNLFFREREMPFVTAAFEFPGGADVSLNFCLPVNEAALIDGADGIRHPDIQAALTAFVNWWPA